jgi:hypothetical protein
VSRQQDYQLRHRAAGLCVLCPNEAYAGGVYCLVHLVKYGLTGAKLTRRALWAAVDWRKTNMAIARQLGVSDVAVFYQRRKRAPITSELLTHKILT